MVETVSAADRVRLAEAIRHACDTCRVNRSKACSEHWGQKVWSRWTDEQIALLAGERRDPVMARRWRAEHPEG